MAIYNVLRITVALVFAIELLSKGRFLNHIGKGMWALFTCVTRRLERQTGFDAVHAAQLVEMRLVKEQKKHRRKMGATSYMKRSPQYKQTGHDALAPSRFEEDCH